MSAREWGVFTLHVGDSREVLRGMADASVDSVVCDPPYELSSDGKASASLVFLELMFPKDTKIKPEPPGGAVLPFLVEQILRLGCVGVDPSPAAPVEIGAVAFDNYPAARQHDVEYVDVGSVGVPERDGAPNVEAEREKHLGCFFLELADAAACLNALNRAGCGFLTGGVGVGFGIDAASLPSFLRGCGIVNDSGSDVRHIDDPLALRIGALGGAEVTTVSRIGLGGGAVDKLTAPAALVLLATLHAGGAQLVGASARASRLPAKFESRRVRVVCDTTRRALAFDLIVHPQIVQSAGFMGKGWDGSKIAFNVALWSEVLRVLKPGGHLLAFSGTRTYHRMVCAIEDAGFDVRDMMSWVYGSGFPKSHDVSKAIDKMGGASVAWFGPWLRAWREQNGISQSVVSALFPSKSGGLTGCVANWELGLNMPTVEQFNMIRDTLNLPFESIEAVRREVIGRSANGIAGGTGHHAGVIDAYGFAAEFDITTPATDAARQWAGWGTALKPAHEPIVLARKPLIGTVAANVLAHGTGGLNIDGCRVPTADDLNGGAYAAERKPSAGTWAGAGTLHQTTGLAFVAPIGRFPANLLHDGSPEVLAAFPSAPGQMADASTAVDGRKFQNVYGAMKRGSQEASADSENEGGVGFKMKPGARRLDSGSAARFFYAAKASARDRNEGIAARANTHPTVKPTDLMRYLCRLITPPGGLILDPFMGSGSTGKAAVLEGFRFVGVDLSEQYVGIAERRIAHAAFGSAAFGGVAA